MSDAAQMATVMVVGDRPASLGTLEDFFRRAGYRVVTWPAGPNLPEQAPGPAPDLSADQTLIGAA